MEESPSISFLWPITGWDVKETAHLLPASQSPLSSFFICNLFHGWWSKLFCVWRTSELASYTFINLTHVITQWAKDSENVHGGWGFIGWGGDCDKLRSTRWREKLQPNKKVTIKWGKLPPILTEKESSKKRILVSEKLTHTPAMCHYYDSSIKILGNTPLGFYFL